MSGSASQSDSGVPLGVARTLVRQAQETAANNKRPAGTRVAGAGGSTTTMLKLYTDDAPGLKVDPIIVMVLAIGFIASVFVLHIASRIMRKWGT
ncbi:Protein transport protein Sec61 subunit beta [Neolecta irregularis DAH-3]|uniref:Protein transport protein Sec61 subunit beta n=1 Tax=Neolecta irregularis (strain DAH-3) TaxID=1198029 RepID=A0A1U7LWP1_NEOID|nr:Protein transport protein Sec61 subunit beta [Neolecta irregularis DAH-3]|eukprot:OLL27054.1 Protein transport protein Sec61 subunit beta [Neolecta irregularis DAH-3]